MATTDVLPGTVEQSVTQKDDSAESIYPYGSELGEACLPESDSRIFPVLTPVYNGRVLNIPPQFVQASLSGISIKHYHGKCCKVEERKVELHDTDHFSQEGETEEILDTWFEETRGKSVSDVSRSYEGSYQGGRPLCTAPKMNFRNSFWNIHRPELCKLTWGQNYVSAATVIEHLHGHLVRHGPLCEGFHTEEERQMLLDKELNEYVRLKVLASPRGIPPDEPFFSALTMEGSGRKKEYPNCKLKTSPEIKIPFDPLKWFIPLADDDAEIAGKAIHRLKEEFCLTIGKHRRLLPIKQSVTSFVQEGPIIPYMSHAAEEEEEENFYFNWHLSVGEETFEEQLDGSSPSQSMTFSDSDSLAAPCPPLMMDEFCKAAGKVDFSDLRCPDL